MTTVLEGFTNDSRLRLRKFAAFSVCAALLASSPAWIDCHHTTALIPQLAPGMYGIGFVLACACAAIAVITFAVLIYSIATAPRSTSTRSHSRIVEGLWALVPIAIVTCAALPSIHALANPSGNASVAYRCEMK
jgi:heme/copper-type cytochrome/quinol oxidase subunit 2